VVSSRHITTLISGAVNAEVELTTARGDKIVAIVPEGSVKPLGLAVGKVAIAYVKAPWVIVLSGTQTFGFRPATNSPESQEH